MGKYSKASTEPWVKRNTQQVQRPLDNTVLIRETVLMNTGPSQKFKVEAPLKSDIYEDPDVPKHARKPNFKTRDELKPFERHDYHPYAIPFTDLQERRDEEPPFLPPRTAIKREPQEQQDDNEDNRSHHFPRNMALLKLHSSSHIDEEICESGHMLLSISPDNSRQALLQQNTTHRDEPEGMSSVDDEVTTPKHVYNTEPGIRQKYWRQKNVSMRNNSGMSSVDDEATTPKQAYNTEPGIRQKYWRQKNVSMRNNSGMSSVDDEATTPKQAYNTGQGDSLTYIKTIYEESHSIRYYPTSSSTPNRLKDVETAAVIDSGNCRTKQFVKGRPRGYENHEIELKHNLEGDLAPIQTITIRQRKPMPTPRQRHTSNVYDEEAETPSCYKMSEFTPSGGLLEQKAFYLKNMKAELKKEIQLQHDILKDGEEVNVLLDQKLINAKQLTKQEMNRDDLETEMKNVNWHMQFEEYYGKTRTLIQVTRPSEAPTHDAMDQATFSEEAEVQESTTVSKLNIYIADSGIAEDNYSPCSESTKL